MNCTLWRGNSGLSGPAGSSFTLSKVWRLLYSQGLCWMLNVKRRPSNYLMTSLMDKVHLPRLRYLLGRRKDSRIHFWNIRYTKRATLKGANGVLMAASMQNTTWPSQVGIFFFFELKQEDIHKEPTHEGISGNAVTSPH